LTDKFLWDIIISSKKHLWDIFIGDKKSPQKGEAMDVTNLQKRIDKCSFLLKTMIKRWDGLGKEAQETPTYKMTLEALDMLEGKFHEMADLKVDIDDETFMQIAIMAHEQDITFNQMVEQALRLQAEKDIAELKGDEDEDSNLED
jgi:hypothetical protein